MDTYCIVRPEHLNHRGYLFGGQMLKWIDEYAYLAAAYDFPGSGLVTRAMDKIDFKQSVRNGAILHFAVSYHKQGLTSVSYFVNVYASDQPELREVLVFSTCVTFVCVDETGKKVPLRSY